MPNEKEPHYTPTPEQIRRDCARIQSEWSPIERERRTCVKNGHAETPLAHICVDED